MKSPQRHVSPLAALTFLGCKVLPSGLEPPGEQRALCTQQQLPAPQQLLAADTGTTAGDGCFTSLHRGGPATTTGDSPNERHSLSRSQPLFSSPEAAGKDLRDRWDRRFPRALAVKTHAQHPQRGRLRGSAVARVPNRSLRASPPRAPPRDLPTSGFLSAAAAPPPAPCVGEAAG